MASGTVSASILVQSILDGRVTAVMSESGGISKAGLEIAPGCYTFKYTSHKGIVSWDNSLVAVIQ